MPSGPEDLATVRLYAGLNQFVPPEARQHDLVYRLNGRVSVKHVIEALGVPHTEVELILVNNKPVTFAHHVAPGDRVAVYPHFATLPAQELAPLRPPVPEPVQFVLDVHLGQLATYLRLLGFDAAYENDLDDAELARISATELRVLLTRDRRLLMRREVVFGFCLHSRDPREQLFAVLRRYALHGVIAPWQRCLSCNGELVAVPKAEVYERLEPLTKRYYEVFHRCLKCDKIYWKGSHFAALESFVDEIRRRAPDE